MIMSIDPGASGGIAWETVDTAGLIHIRVMALKEPDAMIAQIRVLEHDARRDREPLVCVMEKIHASPVMGVSNAFAFGQNYGWWHGVLQTIGVEIILITPQQWQHPLRNFLAGLQGPARKKKLVEVARTRFPGTKLTAATADAALLLDYALSVKPRPDGI